MFKDRVRTEAEALAYLVNCTLATVCDMAMKKSRAKYEYRRQITIAQTGYDWIVAFGIPTNISSRIEEVSTHRGSVAEWAKRFEA